MNKVFRFVLTANRRRAAAPVQATRIKYGIKTHTNKKETRKEWRNKEKNTIRDRKGFGVL